MFLFVWSIFRIYDVRFLQTIPIIDMQLIRTDMWVSF